MRLRSTLAVVVALLATTRLCAQSTDPEDVLHFQPVYGNQAGHPWDVLHEFFFVRRFTTGETYYHRLSFTPPWPQFHSFVQRDDVFEAAISKLEAAEHMPREEMEQAAPIRRLLFFRDLWAVFESLKTTEDGFTREQESSARRNELRRRLARIMQRLELSENEIALLPQTLSLARTEAFYPVAFDKAAPDRPFLPTNVLDDDSDWVCSKTGKWSGTSAPAHEQSVSQRSLFTIHVLAPDGREAGELLLATANKSNGSAAYAPGTVLVLLRRALAATTDGKLIATDVVESLQSIVTPLAGEREDFRQKFVLDRRDAVLGKPGLRRLTDKTPLDAFSFESGGQWSRSPTPDSDGETIVLGQAKGPAGVPSMHHCAACHGLRTREYYANTVQSAIFPASNRELAHGIAKSKSADRHWQDYLDLRIER